jgi:streptomycin 6-kinase
VIDPKPFVGDPAYDTTQHLLNCRQRVGADPHGTIRRVADLTGVDERRASLWLFARSAAEPRTRWTTESLELARRLARTTG